jgi:activator of HSP90 ATPase
MKLPRRNVKPVQMNRGASLDPAGNLELDADSERSNLSSIRKEIMKDNLFTRRRLMTGVTALLGSLAAGSKILAQTAQTNKAEQPGTGPDAARTSLHQEIDLKANPSRVYEALLNSKQFTAFSGEAAEIGREEGNAFSMFGGVILGRNIELIPGQRIVQAWRPTHWPPGVYSIVRFELKAQGGHTMLILDHTGFPKGEFANLNYGWGLKYWKPLEKFLAKPADANDKGSP